MHGVHGNPTRYSTDTVCTKHYYNASVVIQLIHMHGSRPLAAIYKKVKYNIYIYIIIVCH